MMAMVRASRSVRARASVRLVLIVALGGIFCDSSARALPATGGVPVGEASAPAGVAPAAVEDPLTVQVLTFGPGSHPFTKFGHNAIRIIDRRTGSDVVYNFGTFTFDSPRLILDFLKGRLRYWLSRSSTGATLRGYRRENRDIDVQALNLTAEEKRELLDRLEINVRPENRNYRYDYFADNCSTRVRDVLDVVLRGRVHANAGGQGSMSLRRHALRMAADNLPLYTALLIVLGPRTDRPIDEWAEAFLPEMLARTLRRVPAAGESQVESQDESIDQRAAAPGRLVTAEAVLFKANRAPVAQQPPNRLPGFLGVGLLVGASLLLLGRIGSRSRIARVGFGLLVCLIGLVAGIIGCFLVGSWALTPHAVVYRNQNVLLLAPFAIALVALGIGAALGRRGATRKTYWLGVAALVLATAAVMLKLLPGSKQENATLIVMMLPVWFGLTAGALRLWRAMPEPGADQSGP
jgi:hypothetical protein